jgi:hypothetical protein
VVRVSVISVGVETGQGTLSGLQDVLSVFEQTVFVRAALSDRRVVRYLDVTMGSPSGPPDWRAETWRYEGVTFTAVPTSSRALASALDPYDAQILPLGDLVLTLPVLSGQTSWQHKPSRARFDSVALPWPALICEVHQPGGPGGQQSPHGFLIGDDCPSFPTYDAAFRAFSYGDFSRPPGGQVPHSFATVRLVDSRASQVTALADAKAQGNLEDGRALRIETVVNAPGDLGCPRRLHNLDEL